jgi:hypothetical protein
MIEGLQLRGDLKVILKDPKSGSVLQEVEVRNKIVNTGITSILSLLAQNEDSDPADFQITRLEVGEGSTPATVNDTDVETAFGTAQRIELSDANRSLTGNTLLITAAFQDTETYLNNKEVTEATLWTGTGTDRHLFARQAHSAVTKSVGLVLEYRWAIKIIVA